MVGTLRRVSIEEVIADAKSSVLNEVFMKFLPHEGEVLEAGCGLGAWVKVLGDIGYTIQGVDVSMPYDPIKGLKDETPFKKIYEAWRAKERRDVEASEVQRSKLRIALGRCLAKNYRPYDPLYSTESVKMPKSQKVLLVTSFPAMECLW